MNSYENYGYLNLADEERGRRKPKKDSFLHTLLFYILPFIVINLIIFFIVTAQPKFEVSVNDPGDFKTAEIVVNIKSVFPVKNFSVLLNSEPVEMTETEKRSYSATVESNGTVEVVVENLNGMSKTIYENISYIDDNPPTLTEADSGVGYVSLYVEDSQSGINFESVYALESSGKRIEPSLKDEGDGLVVFNYDSPRLEVHVSDNCGRESIVTFGE